MELRKGPKWTISVSGGFEHGLGRLQIYKLNFQNLDTKNQIIRPKKVVLENLLFVLEFDKFL